ncbi:GntR family transcriptional regulator [Streptomyces sp. NBC_01275]|uniref:GntR family transcriptional regulator n=1 Tax=Streptomyces sp. NBC_01275 TaxID=2903807 RepID=UPI0022538A0A|nr:GntR family transcriptional regulator [Streptomyces sp. NBC_01275]MCX4767303.1 GntR family transcriptional regulator [Streptomyces sp. NBC_01275]
MSVVDGTPAPGAGPEAAPGGRRMALDVHSRLRGMILSGELPPGSALLQAEMARKLGVSRTPMREAFRLLQEEGLIDARPDQRARVRAVDPQDLDGVYGARIMLEALAVTTTAKTLTGEDLDRMSELLERMKALADEEKPDEWYAAHREFHGVATQAVGPQLRRTLSSHAEHSERYIRLAQLGVPGSRARAHKEHEALLAALKANDAAEAARVVAGHLARTALSVLADVAPEYEPVTTRTALRLVGAGQA